MDAAREEANRLLHDFIGTEHLMLALIREEEDSAVQVLRELNVDLEALKKMTEEATVPSRAFGVTGVQTPFTPRAKQAIQIAREEARARKMREVNLFYLLLALVKDKKGVASQVFNEFGVNYDRLKDRG